MNNNVVSIATKSAAFQSPLEPREIIRFMTGLNQIMAETMAVAVSSSEDRTAKYGRGLDRIEQKAESDLEKLRRGYGQA